MTVTDQFNLRIPSELARCVRIDAAERGVRPRDVIVELLEARFGPRTPTVIDGQLNIESSDAKQQDPAPGETSPGQREPGPLTVDETQGPDPSRDDAGTSPPASRRPRAAHKAERSTGSTPESSETVNATATTPSGDGDGRRDREALVPVVDRSAPGEAPIPDGAPVAVEAGTPAGCPECGGEFQDIAEEPYQRCEDCGFLPWGNARA